MRVFEGLYYVKRDTAVHRLDPRAKLVYVLCITILSTAVFHTALPMILLFISAIPLAVEGRVLRRLLSTLRGGAMLVVFIFIFNFIGRLWNIGFVSPFSPEFLEALMPSLAMALRFLTLIAAFSIFFLTTSPDDFAQALVQMRLPYDYSLTFTMAMRFIPTLAREAQIVADAQKSRGLELEKGGFMQRIRNYIPILVPLIVSSFRRAETIADAMESRAFGASKKRSFLYMLKFKPSDTLFSVICIAITAAIIWLRLSGFLPP